MPRSGYQPSVAADVIPARSASEALVCSTAMANENRTGSSAASIVSKRLAASMRSPRVQALRSLAAVSRNVLTRSHTLCLASSLFSVCRVTVRRAKFSSSHNWHSEVSTIRRFMKASIPLLSSLYFAAALARAAPLPPLPAIDVCGAIESYRWSAQVVLSAKPGFSGSLGHRRVFPPRFELVLKDYDGVDPALAARINGLMGYRAESGSAPRLELLIASPRPHMLDGVPRLCVLGYSLRGDEGGTWTSYRRLSLDTNQ